jgi:hypothetical protein
VEFRYTVNALMGGQDASAAGNHASDRYQRVVKFQKVMMGLVASPAAIVIDTKGLQS